MLVVLDVVFLTKFSQDSFHQYCYSCCKDPYVQESVRFGIGSSVQEELLSIDLDHCLVKRDVIRTCTIGGGGSTLCTQSCTACRERSTPNFSNFRTVFKSDIPATCSRIPSFISRRGVNSCAIKSNLIQSLSPLERVISSIDQLKITLPHPSALIEHDHENRRADVSCIRPTGSPEVGQ